MTFQDQAVLTQLLFFVFCAGIFTGAICTGLLNTLKKIFFNEVHRPNRIKTLFGYLYRLDDHYVDIEYRNEICATRREKMLSDLKKNPSRQSMKNHFLFWSIACIILMAYLFIYLDPFTPLHLK